MPATVNAIPISEPEARALADAPLPVGRGARSRPQVFEPVNARSVGRWKHYERHFTGKVLALLTPWIERWGY